MQGVERAWHIACLGGGGDWGAMRTRWDDDYDGDKAGRRERDACGPAEGRLAATTAKGGAED